MKYLEEWSQTRDKKLFVELLLRKFPHITKKTAERRYYDVRNTLPADIKKSNPTPVRSSPPPSLIYLLEDEHDIAVGVLKMLVIKDMKRYNMKITPELLKINGFNKGEIVWLVKNKYINLEVIS